MFPPVLRFACASATFQARAQLAARLCLATDAITPPVRNYDRFRAPRRAWGALSQRRPTRILPGGEVSAGALDALDDGELASVSLGGSGGWILLEPAAGPLDERLDQAVGSLRRRGLRALLAHPERHLEPDIVDRLRRLICHGALVQATAASLLDRATRDGMLTLVRAGVVRVIGSDAHSSRWGRPVALAAAIETLGAAEPTASHGAGHEHHR